MVFIRTFAVCVYLIVMILFGIPYFYWLEKRKEVLGGDIAVQQKSYALGRRMAKRILKLTGSTLVLQGEEHLPKEGTVLFVANHQSYMDIPVMMAAIPYPIGFIAKEELGKIPVFSKWLQQLHCVLIARGDTRKALVAILQAAKYLKEGKNLVLFPEGTRSEDGTLGMFKAGSLKAAQKGNAIIVPVALQGSCDLMPRNALWMHKTTVTVTFLPAISAEEGKQMETKELAFIVKSQIGNALGQVVQREDGDE